LQIWLSLVSSPAFVSLSISHFSCCAVIADRDLDETQLDENIGMAVAFTGLYMQLKFGFQLPFPLNVLLAPFSLTEWFLTMLVGVTANKDNVTA
jgi:hypothetical protein